MCVTVVYLRSRRRRSRAAAGRSPPRCRSRRRSARPSADSRAASAGSSSTRSTWALKASAVSPTSTWVPSTTSRPSTPLAVDTTGVPSASDSSTLSRVPPPTWSGTTVAAEPLIASLTSGRRPVKRTLSRLGMRSSGRSPVSPVTHSWTSGRTARTRGMTWFRHHTTASRFGRIGDRAGIDEPRRRGHRARTLEIGAVGAVGHDVDLGGVDAGGDQRRRAPPPTPRSPRPSSPRAATGSGRASTTSAGGAAAAAAWWRAPTRPSICRGSASSKIRGHGDLVEVARRAQLEADGDIGARRRGRAPARAPRDRRSRRSIAACR